MCPGDVPGNLGQGRIAPITVVVAALQDHYVMSSPSPLPHQSGSGLDPTLMALDTDRPGLLEISPDGFQLPRHRPCQPAVHLLLQAPGDASGEEVGAQGWRRLPKDPPPLVAQLRCRHCRQGRHPLL